MKIMNTIAVQLGPDTERKLRDQKLRELMSPDGVYLMNVLDIYESGLFLGAIVNTFHECFPYVYAFSAVANGPSH